MVSRDSELSANASFSAEIHYFLFELPNSSTGRNTILGTEFCFSSVGGRVAEHPLLQQLPTRLRLPSSELNAPHNAYAAHALTNVRTRRC